MNIQDIIDEGYCVGCGVCSFLHENIFIDLNEVGLYQPKISKTISAIDEHRILSACPFSDIGSNETEIAEELFGNELNSNPYVGKFNKLFAGHAVEDNFREISTSGGMITWLLCQLLKQNLVDSVVHVKASPESKTLFSYSVSHT